MRGLRTVQVGDKAVGRVYAPLLCEQIQINIANKDECAELLRSQVGAVCVIHSFSEIDDHVSITLRPSDGVQWDGVIKQSEYNRE